MNLFRSFLSKFTIFILSLLLAILIWIIASQENDPALLQSFPLPVDIVGQTEDSNLDISTETIIVVVEAASSVMQTLEPDDFSAVIDLRDVIVGEKLVNPGRNPYTVPTSGRPAGFLSWYSRRTALVCVSPAPT